MSYVSSVVPLPGVGSSNGGLVARQTLLDVEIDRPCPRCSVGAGGLRVFRRRTRALRPDGGEISAEDPGRTAGRDARRLERGPAAQFGGRSVRSRLVDGPDRRRFTVTRRGVPRARLGRPVQIPRAAVSSACPLTVRTEWLLGV